MISFEDFGKIELKIAKIKTAEKIDGSNKLLKLIVDVGGEERQIISGIAASYAPEDLFGKSIVVVTNLEPRAFFGLESQAMLLAASHREGENPEKPVLIVPESETLPGTKIK